MAGNEVPESRFDPDEALVPETPDGYDDPTAFQYPLPVLFLGSLVVMPLAFVGFGAVFWWAQGPAVLDALVTSTETETGLEISFSVAPALATFLVVIVVTTVVHELIHGVVAGRYGYTVTYGAAPHMGAFYATPFHQFVTREHLIPVALAPLVVISLVGLPLCFVPVPWVAFAAFLALVFNATGAVGDLYITLLTLRLPPGTLFYDSDIRHSYVFRPSTPE
jgi:hypothetical protein